MSWATCYSGCNNIHVDSPPMMADGRNYTVWQPESVINQTIKQKNFIKSNWEYRQYLTKNGLDLMKTNYDTNELGKEQSSMYGQPFLFTNLFDSKTPPFGYNESDLKNPYLTREQLNARLISPSIHPDNQTKNMC